MIPRSMLKTYLQFIVPSTLAFLLTGIYSIADGFFVGRAVGDAGIAGVNVAWPLIAIVFAVGTGVGMGGAVVASVQRGEGDANASECTMAHTLVLLALAGIPCMLVMLLCARPILFAIGGRAEVLENAQLYVSIMAWGAILQLIGCGSVPLIRAKDKAIVAMLIMAVSGAINMVGDYVLIMVLDWGVAGAAIATVVSEGLSGIAAILFFLLPKYRLPTSGMRLQGALVVRTVRAGFAPAALTLLPEVTNVVMNITTEIHGGETAQAAFAVIAYIIAAQQWIIQGVGDGSQPLISRAFGGGEAALVRQLRNTNYAVNLGIALVMIVLLYAFRMPLAGAFGLSQQASIYFSQGVTIYVLVLAFYAITHATASYFYAIEAARSANALVFAELAATLLFGIVLPLAFGLPGVWCIVVATQAVLLVLCFWLLKTSARGVVQG